MNSALGIALWILVAVAIVLVIVCLVEAMKGPGE